MRKNKSQPTGTDVARLAGVSKSAVSRAFNGGKVSAKSKERILKAAKKIHYKPNLAARALTTNSSKLIGLAVTHLDNQVYPQFIQAISTKLADKGYRCVLFITEGEADLEPVLNELLGYRLDGVILASSSIAVRVAKECMATNVPVIMFNNVDPDGEVPGICADNFAGAQSIAQHFIQNGFRRLAVIEGISLASTSMERTRGFIDEATTQGLTSPQTRCGDYTFEGAERAALSLLDPQLPPETRPEAIFCVNDHMAFGALKACHDLGLKPGRDIAIASFDNAEISHWPCFSLTSYSQPIDQMVDACLDYLMKAIAGNPQNIGTKRIAGELHIRSSSLKQI